MNWHQLISNIRLGQEHLHIQRKDDRTEFKRDYDRLIFSAPFRRLQNKTQVFPLPGSIFVHNRLTHSLEVSSVGRSLGDDVSRRLLQLHPELADSHITECGAIVSAACLAHDMGNPPFGHSGERAIATYFSESEGQKYREMMTAEEWSDLIHFDGNANALRLLAHQFKGRRPGGFVLTYSTLASIVKYPFSSSQAGKKQKFGFFCTEAEGIIQHADGTFARHPLVYLVEAADDICYEIMDIEDAHKLKILSTEETTDILLRFCDPERKDRILTVLNSVDDINERIVYLRSCAIGELERECVSTFIANEESILNGSFQGSLIKNMTPRLREAYTNSAHISAERIPQQRRSRYRTGWLSHHLHPHRPLHGSRHASRPCLFAIAPQPCQPAIRSGCPRRLPPHHGSPRLHLRHDRRLCTRPLPQNQWRKPANDLGMINNLGLFIRKE